MYGPDQEKIGLITRFTDRKTEIEFGTRDRTLVSLGNTVDTVIVLRNVNHFEVNPE